MDKNFIKIDDLFRQRLGGGEERERSGAWLNMRELLDKEMPQQKRIGIFYWRRLFSAVAALSLVGTVCIGSYELSSAFKNRNTADVVLPGSIAANHEVANTYEMPVSEGMKGEAARVAARTNEHRAHTTTQKHRHVASAGQPGMHGDAGNINRTTLAGAAATPNENATGNTQNSANNTNSTITNSTNNSSNNNNEYQIGQAKAIAGVSKVTGDAKERGSRSRNVERPAAQASVGNNGAQQSAGKDLSVLAAGSTNTAHAPATTGKQQLANGNKKATDILASKANTGGVSHQPAKADNAKTGKNTLHSNTPGKNAEDNLALNSGVHNQANKPSGAKMNNAISATHGNAAITDKASGSEDAANKEVAKNTSSVADAPKAGAEEATVANGSEVTAEKPAEAAAPVLRNANSVNNTNSKKVITKLLVHQRSIKVSENEYATKLDTISRERIEMDLGFRTVLANNTPPAEPIPAAKGRKAHKGLFGSRKAANAGATPGAVSSPKPSGAQPVASAAKHTGGSQSAAASAMEPEANAAAPADPVMGAAAPAAEVAKDAAEIKPNASATKHSGASLLQKMSMAFNDVKDNAARTRFEPGLTAGINSSFFGPNSFKGFQFGLTGDIIFNDSWNIMTELKYFHRLNNNTSVDDNFYTYTPVGTQYRKDLQLNSYSFSALHSLEMPVAVRYHRGNFNFYAGGNFLYSFTINTGAFTRPAGVAPEYVNEAGTDNKGTLTEQDFKSRFGLGYLFGFSYDIAPNVSLDLRNVQTVWDNAATTGAKSISDQLYKTPSLQLSIMYRLGGNRNKD